MIQTLIEAVCIALHGAFGDGYRKYTEAVPQGLQTPCFFVLCPEASDDPLLGLRHRRHHALAIQFLPDEADPARLTCHEVAERLFLCLETVEAADGPWRGTGMRYEVADGVLHFFVDYNATVLLPRETPLMTTLQHDVTPKH